MAVVVLAAVTLAGLHIVISKDSVFEAKFSFPFTLMKNLQPEEAPH